jgi:hypothetical protein
LEDIYLRRPGQDKMLEALERITMELMEKHAKAEGSAGVDDLKRWPLDSDAFGFLLAIGSAGSVDELKSVSLFPGNAKYSTNFSPSISTHSSRSTIAPRVSWLVWRDLP